MITEGDAPERIKEEIAFADEAIALAHEYVCTGASTWKAALSSLFVARAAQAMRSCGTLAVQGAIGDAMSVGRTVVELEIEHAYIMQTDTERRWERYVAYEVTSRDQLVQAIGRLHDDKVDQQALAHSRREAQIARNKLGSRKKRKQNGQRQATQPTQPGATIKDRASATGRNKNYELAYRDMCGASHGGFSTLWYVTMPTDKLPFAVLVGYGRPSVKPIALALQSMLQLLQIVTTDTGLDALQAKVDGLVNRVLDAYKTRGVPTA